MENGKLVGEGVFCEVVSDNYREEYGVCIGDIVFVAGSGFVPMSEDDPYLFRQYFAIVKFDGDAIDFKQKPLVVKPEGLKVLPEESQSKYQNILDALYKAFTEEQTLQ